MYFTCISMFLLVLNLRMLFAAFCQYPIQMMMMMMIVVSK